MFATSITNAGSQTTVGPLRIYHSTLGAVIEMRRIESLVLKMPALKVNLQIFGHGKVLLALAQICTIVLSPVHASLVRETTEFSNQKALQIGIRAIRIVRLLGYKG